MSSLTLHNIDPAVDIRLTESARLAGISKNQLIKDILARSTGQPGSNGLAADYQEFCGLWTQVELEEFTVRQADNSRIDPEDWA